MPVEYNHYKAMLSYILGYKKNARSKKKLTTFELIHKYENHIGVHDVKEKVYDSPVAVSTSTASSGKFDGLFSDSFMNAIEMRNTQKPKLIVDYKINVEDTINELEKFVDTLRII